MNIQITRAIRGMFRRNYKHCNSNVFKARMTYKLDNEHATFLSNKVKAMSVSYSTKVIVSVFSFFIYNLYTDLIKKQLLFS